MTRVRLAAIGVAAVTAAAAPAVSSGRTAVSVTAGKPSELSFTLSAKSVKAGSVTFRIRNAGSVPHSFSIGGRTSATLARGRTTTLTVTLAKGSVAFRCKVPGHAAAGMKGKLLVRRPARARRA